MFVTLSVYLEADQVVNISNDPDNPDGIMVEVWESDEKTPSPRLHLSPAEVIQLGEAMKAVNNLRSV